MNSRLAKLTDRCVSSEDSNKSGHPRGLSLSESVFVFCMKRLGAPSGDLRWEHTFCRFSHVPGQFCKNESSWESPNEGNEYEK